MVAKSKSKTLKTKIKGNAKADAKTNVKKPSKPILKGKKVKAIAKSNAPKNTKGPQKTNFAKSKIQASKAPIKVAVPEVEDAAEDEFDPAAFFAASGGQGIFRAQVMRKDRVDFNLPIRYRFITGPLVYPADLLNLSKGGLCLKTPKIIKPKTILKIEIPLPHTSELFNVQAECIWSDHQDSKESDAAMTGLRFLTMSLAKQTVINNFIQQRRDELIMAKIGLDKFRDSIPVAGLD